MITVDHTEDTAYLEITATEGDYTYYGRCSCNSSCSMSQPIWQIWRTNTTESTWAEGNTLFDNVWNDRASLVYPVAVL